MTQKEQELFLELCAFRNPKANKIERLLRAGAATSNVLGMLFSNRVAGIAYYVLKETELLDLVDREFRTSIRNASLLNEKINEDFLACIKDLSVVLEPCGVPYALLKGAYLCHRYPKGCRTSNDVDVLISPENVSIVSNRLKAVGFQQGYLKNSVFVPATRQQIIESKMMRGETVPFIKETKLPFMKYLEVDLNFSLDYKNGDDTTIKKLLSRTYMANVNEVKIRTLHPFDFVLHLCTHLYKEATTMPWVRMKRDMTFYKFCDVYEMLQDFNIVDIDTLVLLAQSMSMQQELLYTLDCVKSFYGLLDSENLRLLYEDDFPLDRVFAPAEKKLYRYSEPDPQKRFFADDRVCLLNEVSL